MRTFTQALLAAGLVLLGSASVAYAQVPSFLPLQGFLTDGAGGPIDAPAGLLVTFRILDGATGGTLLHQETQVLAVDGGHFSAYLGDGSALDLGIFEANPDLWLSISVEGEAELLPRIQLGSVAYAAMAGRAAAIDWTQIENRPPGLDSGVTTLAGADPIRIAANTVSLSSIGCDAGEAWVWNGSAWNCQTVGGTYSAGFGIDLSPGGEIGLNVAAAAQIARDEAFDTVAELRTALDPTYQRLVSGTCPTGIASISAAGVVTCAAASSGDISAVRTPGGSGLSGGAESGEVSLAVDFSQVQRRVGTACAAGNVLMGLNADGTPNCQVPQVLVSAVARNIQARVSGTCPFGIASIGADGTASCASAQTAAYTAGTRIFFSGSSINVDASGLQPTLAYTGFNTTVGCRYGIAYIEPANGFVYCIAEPTQNRFCPNNHYMHGINADGSPNCRSLGVWFNNNCLTAVGYCDNNLTNPNTGNACAFGHITAAGTVYGRSGEAVFANTHNWDGVRTGGTWMTPIKFRGDVDGNDRLWIGVVCFE